MLPLSFRMKIMICCIGLVALLDLTVVIFVRTRLLDALRAEYLAKGHNMAVNLSARSEHFVLTEEFVSLLQLVTDLKDSDEDIAYAYVADRKGRVLAHTFTGGFPADLVGVNTPRPGEKWSQEVLDAEEEGLIHDIGVPVLQGRAGFVHVGISDTRVHRTISRFTMGIVAIAGVVLLIAVALAGVVSWIVVQPVRSLTRAAQKIRDGDLGQQVVATTRDDIGDLVDSFNQMSRELLKQHTILEDRNRRIRIAQEQAAGERDKLRAIIDSMVEGVIFVNAEGTVSLCNESAERIWGVSAQELLGRPLLECHPPPMRAKVAKILEQAKQQPGFAVTREMEGTAGRCCLSNYSSVHGEDGHYLGLVLLSQDISERMNLEQERKRLRDQLFQQEKMVLIGQIAASVAHELNTPLGTILLRSQLIQHQMAGKGAMPDLQVIEGEAQRCRRIIDSLLGFSRRTEGIVSRTNIDALIRESLSLIENDLTLKGISLETHLASDGATARVDGDQIQQVLLNLATNAADAMPNGGHLKVATRSLPAERVVEIQLTDDGSGMKQGVLDRAFDAFFTTKERGKGTGLGLAICRHIVEEYEGQIEISSQLGQGTVVLIRLPQAGMEAATDE